ncbi:tetratricopeptide repeat protein [uncultured Desulfosarcina sp.]|uniref:tetratricopeptide repeat protein n=1 Tax=uncultured Desulfosarcina sp. TaxID=218289 RepID=UPI0029C825B5|nr:tetratricopeptide repeat protein [uncultured Desulfosarcina sp.]
MAQETEHKIQFTAKTGLLVAAIVLLTLIAYLPAIQSGYIWDDDDYVTENQTLWSSGGLAQIWMSPKSTPQYYPLVHSSFWLEYQLWELNPMGYHITNVLLHIGAAMLLWRGLFLLGLPYSWVAAFIFALHPVHVESVAWITERKNVLSMVFYLSAAICMFYRLDLVENKIKPKRSWFWYLGGLFFFACALLSKTVTCSLPAALLLLIWWRRGRVKFLEVLDLLPFFALGLVGGLSTAWLEQHHVGAQGVEWNYGLVERVLIAGRVIWFYAGKLFWPGELVFNYPRWSVDSGAWWQYFFPVAVISVTVFLWFMRRRWGRGPLTAFLFFCGTLFPALGFIDVYPFRYSFVADHFQYHASIGLIAAAVVAGGRLIGSWPVRRVGALAGVVIALLAVCTYYQCYDYHDVETLWRRTIAKNDGSWLAHNNLGVILYSRGKDDEALQHYLAAVESQPNYTEALNNLGSLYAGKGESDRALSYFEEALSVEPGNVLAHYNLGVEYADRGEIDKAMRYYRKTLQLNPEYTRAHNNLGRLLMNLNRDDEAQRHFRLALEYSPRMVQAHINLGAIALKKESINDAILHSLAAIDLQPENAQAHTQLAIAYSRLDKMEKAIEAFETAWRLDPNDASIQANLGTALFRKNRFPEARDAYERALALTPQRSDLQANLADTYAALGNKQKAVDFYRRALARDPDSLRTRLNYGIFMARNGNLDAALEQFNAVLRTHPESVEAHRSRVQAQWLAGYHAAARDSYSALKKISPIQAAELAGFIPELEAEFSGEKSEG